MEGLALAVSAPLTLLAPRRAWADETIEAAQAQSRTALLEVWTLVDDRNRSEEGPCSVVGVIRARDQGAAPDLADAKV